MGHPKATHFPKKGSSKYKMSSFKIELTFWSFITFRILIKSLPQNAGNGFQRLQISKNLFVINFKLHVAEMHEKKKLHCVHYLYIIMQTLKCLCNEIFMLKKITLM